MSTPKAAILAIGSELTAGRTLDTNSAWLSKNLAALGITVVLQVACPDDMELMVESLKVLEGHADLVLVTGGLGPTADDFTRDAIARYAELDLKLDQPTLDHIIELFNRFGRVMPETNKNQAMFPEGCEILFNDQGTAPGFMVKKIGTTFLCMPGVPREMKAMYDKQVRPRLEEKLGESYHIAQRTLRTCSISESKLDKMLAGIEERGVELAFAVKEAEGTIMLTYTARGASKDEIEALVQGAVEESERRLGSLVCARGADTLPQVVLALLKAKNHDLAVIEGECGGRLCGQLTNCQGAEEVLKEGHVLVGQDRQRPFLSGDVPENLRERALALARRLREQSQVSYAVAIIGPGSEPDAKMTLAVVGPRDEVVKERGSGILIKSARDRFLTLAAAYSLDTLRIMLEEEADR
jgi:nicotinamide-nucleotide amidase